MAEKKKPESIEDAECRRAGLEPGKTYEAKTLGGLHLPKTEQRAAVKPGEKFDAEGRELYRYGNRVAVKQGRAFALLPSVKAENAETARWEDRQRSRMIGNSVDTLDRMLRRPEVHRAIGAVGPRTAETTARLRSVADAMDAAREKAAVDEAAEVADAANS